MITRYASACISKSPRSAADDQVGIPEAERDSHLEDLGLALFQIALVQPRPATDHSLSVHRVEVQSRLSLLLVLQQQSQRHDRRHSQALDRLAAFAGFARVGTDGRRAAAAAKVHS